MTMGPLAVNNSSSDSSRRALYKLALANPTHGEESEHDVYRDIQESSGAVLSLLFTLGVDDKLGALGTAADNGAAKLAAPTKNGHDLLGAEVDDPDGIVGRISRSSLSRAFGKGVKIRLHPDDFKHHFHYEAMCLILECV